MKNKLSFIENAIHFSVWTFACFSSLYKLLESQTDLLEGSSNYKHTLVDLKPGWRILGKLKDESDVEWSTWKYLIKILWFYLLGQFLISEILRTFCVSIVKYWYIISSIFFITHYMSINHLTMIIIQPVIFWTIVYFGGKRISIWVTGIVLLAVYNTLKYKYYFWQLMDCENDEDMFLMFYAVAWVELRCISFCLDYISKKEKNLNYPGDKNETYFELTAFEEIINMFSYVLYLPVLLIGPIIIYEEFEKSFHVRQEKLLLKIKQFFCEMTVYFIYSMLLELSLHYIYFMAMQSNVQLVRILPFPALCGAGLWMGLEFYMKYLISYGMNASYSRLDNIDPPPTPRCILRIHLYSQMWRYFDVGFYKFLFKYIYIPAYNTLKYYVQLSKLSYKLISSLVTFIFIFIWHGTTWNIFIWASFNYFGIVLETAGKALGQSKIYIRFKNKVLRTDTMETRFIACICVPLLLLSAISNFYLFAGAKVGNIYLEQVMSPSLYEIVVIFLSFYCCCHVAIAIEDVPSRTGVKTA